MVSSLIASSLFANATDEAIIKFEKMRFSKNSQIKVKDIKINVKKDLPVKNWKGYIVDVIAEVQGKELKAKDIVFSNGEVVTPELLDIKTGRSLKDMMSPNLSAVYYNKSHLIAGNHKAKNKIVIFSDPLCPFCMDYVPEVINHVKKNNKSIALYYYHFPLLRLHPAADALTKLMDVAKAKGMKDVELKVYEADWDPYFSERETNHQKIIDGFNKVFKTNITFNEVMNKEIRERILTDIQMGEEVMVQGTPTIFINGQKDNSKLKYETLGK
jgi:protein-disulfide isomerase